jgi:hypothetical protein
MSCLRSLAPRDRNEVVIATKRTQYPLRKIVSEESNDQALFSRKKVRLECGHVIWCSTANIYRARCRHCHSENR